MPDLKNVDVRRHTAVKLADLPWELGILPPPAVVATLRGRFDVVHAHTIGYWPTFVGMVKKALDRTRLVITPHSNPGSRNYGFIDARMVPLSYADGLVALTELERNHLISLGMRADRIVVIPNGVDCEKFQSYRRANRVEAGNVLYVGRIDLRHKGCDTLVRAMGRVLAAIDNATLTLLGPDWGDCRSLMALVKSLGIGDKVKYVGAVLEEEKLYHYAIADVCVIPSNIEPFGIVALEAMASGKPVVATRVGGLREVVRDGETGILVPRGDEKALAGAITYLLQHPNVCAEMGSRGRDLAKKYSWDTVAERVERLYSRLVG